MEIRSLNILENDYQLQRVQKVADSAGYNKDGRSSNPRGYRFGLRKQEKDEITFGKALKKARRSPIISQEKIEDFEQELVNKVAQDYRLFLDHMSGMLRHVRV